MNEPPTLILCDGDEERTLVDCAQLSGPEQAFAGSGQPASRRPQSPNGGGAAYMAPRTSRVWRSLLANHGREMIEVSVAISILVGLALIMHQQWRIAEDVREVLGDIRTTRGDIGTSSPEALPAIRETYDGGDIARHAFRKELTQEERVALERQAAALIASHDLPAALDRYEALAAHFPDDGTFGDVITVLRAKLRCERSAGLGSGACR